MAKGSVNKVMLVGYLGQDPEIRYTASNVAVANLSVATNEGWKDKNTGEWVDRTEWHRIVLFRALAEIAQNYLKKGSLVYLEGKLQTRKWQDREGNDRYTTEIVADNMQMLGGRGASGGEGMEMSKNHVTPEERSSDTPSDNRANIPPKPEADFDDDIPF